MDPTRKQPAPDSVRISGKERGPPKPTDTEEGDGLRAGTVLAGQTVNSAHYCDFYGACAKICEDFAQNFGDEMIKLAVASFSRGIFDQQQHD
jgi:hypothetical protein